MSPPLPVAGTKGPARLTKQELDHQDDADGGPESDLAGLKHRPEDEHRRNLGAVAGPAPGGHEHHIEVAEGGGDGNDQRHGDFSPQGRQRHGQELPERSRAPSILAASYNSIGDLLDAGGEEHKDQAERHPGPNQTQGRKGEGEVAEPGPRLTCVKSDQVEAPIQWAVGGVYPAPGHRHHGQGQDGRAKTEWPGTRCAPGSRTRAIAPTITAGPR